MQKKGKIPNYICVFLIIVFMFLMCIFYYRSYDVQKLNIFFDFCSEKVSDLTGILLAAILGGIIGELILKKKVLIWVINILLLALIFYSVSGMLKVQSKIYEEKEQSSNKDIRDKVTAGNEVYSKIPYIFDDDPFFIKKREEYFGIKKGSLMDDKKIVEYMADTIFRDMTSEGTKKKQIPQSYEKHTQAAELLYDTYVYQRKRDNHKKITYAVKVSKLRRIDILVFAIQERIDADEVYQNSENRRIISLYYKDLGDDYSEQEKALENFEESVKWAMKSFYSSYAQKDYKKMTKICDQLENTVTAMKGLTEVDSERVERIGLCCDAYKLIVEKYLS